jgi:acyl carrier protein
VANREPLDDTQFFGAFYANTDVPADTPRRLRPIYSKFFDIEMGKLRPDDRPPEIADLDTVDLVRDIETEFDIAVPDKDAEQIDGSFDSIVRFLSERSRLSR